MTPSGRIAKLFAALASASIRRPAAVLCAWLAAGALCTFFLVRTPFFSDMTKVLPRNTPVLKTTISILEDFQFGGGLDVAVRAEPQAFAPFVAALVGELRGSSLVSDVVASYSDEYRITADPTFLTRLVLNLPTPIVERLMGYATPAGFDKAIAAWKRDRGALSPEALRDEPLLLRQAIADALFTRDDAPWLLNRLRLSSDGRWLHVTIRGARPSADIAFSEQILAQTEAAVARARAGTPGIEEVLIAGGYAKTVENRKCIARDIRTTIAVSAVLVLALFLLSFRAIGSLLHVLAPLALSAVVAFGLCSALFGSLFLGTLIFGAIFIGLGIDFPIHLYNQLSIEAPRRESWREAIVAASATVGPGVAIAAGTTIAAFALFLFSRFRPLVEMGATITAGLLLCLLATFTLLPAMLALFEGRAARALAQRKSPPLMLQAVMRRVAAFPRAVSIGALVLALVSVGVIAFGGGKGMRFSFDPRQYQPFSPGYRAQQERVNALFPDESRYSIVVVAMAPGREEMVERLFVLKGILDNARGHNLILAYYSPIRLFRDRRSYAFNDALVEERLSGKPLLALFDDAARRAGENPLQFESTRKTITAFEQALADPALADPYGDLASSPWADAIVRGQDGFMTAVPLSIDPLKQNPSDLKRIAAFLEGQLGRHHADWASLSGWFILDGEITHLVMSDFFWITAAASLALIAMVFAFFRRPLPSLLALLPVALAVSATLAAMRLFGFTFNFVTIAAFPLIIGSGVDGGAHVLSRALSPGERLSSEALPAVSRAILFSTLTTISAFGSFVTSFNPAFRELGWIVNIGLTVSFLAAVLVLPALIGNAAQRGMKP